MKIVRINRETLIDLGVQEIYPKILKILKYELPMLYEKQQKTETSARAQQLYQEYEAITDPTRQTLLDLSKALRKFETRSELKQLFSLIGQATHQHSGKFDQDTAVPRLQKIIDQMVQNGWDLLSVVPIYNPLFYGEGGANDLVAMDYYFKKH